MEKIRFLYCCIQSINFSCASIFSTSLQLFSSLILYNGDRFKKSSGLQNFFKRFFYRFSNNTKTPTALISQRSGCHKINYYIIEALLNDLCVNLALKLVNLICLLPRKVEVVAAKVSISSCLLVDRTTKVEHLDDSCRTKVECITNCVYKSLV